MKVGCLSQLLNLSLAVKPEPVTGFVHPCYRDGRDSSSYFCTEDSVSH